MKPRGWINPHADLVGIDGNAFAVMGYTRLWLRAAGNSDEIIAQYTREARASDYDNLLHVSMMYTGMIPFADDAAAERDRFLATAPTVIPDDATDAERERLRFPVVPPPD